MKITAKTDTERFQTGANRYARYLETPEGRLRSDLAFANLRDFIPTQSKDVLCALDIGSGTGGTAVRVAQLGVQVTLLDSSEEMLGIAKHAAQQAGVILCHNLLEYVDDPGSILRAGARALRDSSSIFSVLVRNQAGEVLKAAILAGDLSASEKSLTEECGKESLFGGRVKLFTSDSLRPMLKVGSLEVIAERGVRVVADYLPPSVSRNAEYDRIFGLERELGSRPEFAAVARYIQYLARRANPVMENRE
jgi:SAM-dependent methyltransferase